MKQKQTKVRIWFDTATTEQIAAVRLDASKVAAKIMTEDEFKAIYGFVSRSARNYLDEIDGIRPKPVIVSSDRSSNGTVTPGDIIDSVKPGQAWKVLSVELTEDTIKTFKDVCQSYKDRGIKVKFVQEYIISEALRRFFNKEDKNNGD